MPQNTPLTIQVIKEQQKLDPVLSIVYDWIKSKTKPETLNPSIKGNSFLHTYYKQFSHLYIDPTSHRIHYFLDNPRSFEELNSPSSQPIINKTRICLLFILFYVAFMKTHSHGHSGEKLSIETFNQFYYKPHLPLWFPIFIHDCLECQTNKHFPLKHNIAPHLPFYENATHFNCRIPMDTKGPISTTSNGNSYIFAIIDAFSHFIITNPTSNIKSKHATNTLLYHWITKFGPPQYLVTDRGTEYKNQYMTHLCSLHIKHSPRTPFSPWTNGLVENQKRNIGTHLRLFLLDPP